jgi:hypothetical protein
MLQLEDGVHAGHALRHAHLLPQAARRGELGQVPPQVGPLVRGCAAGVLLVQLPCFAVYLQDTASTPVVQLDPLQLHSTGAGRLKSLTRQCGMHQPATRRVEPTFAVSNTTRPLADALASASASCSARSSSTMAILHDMQVEQSQMSRAMLDVSSPRTAAPWSTPSCAFVLQRTSRQSQRIKHQHPAAARPHLQGSASYFASTGAGLSHRNSR